MPDSLERPTWRTTALGAAAHGAAAAVVAVGCYYTANQLPFMKETYWAPIAAVVVLYPDRESTQKAVIARLVGTTLGSLIGWGAAVWWHHNLLLYGVAVLLAVGLCYLARLEAAARLCAVAGTVITLIPRAEPAHLVAFHRFLEVSYGVTWALVYTVLLAWLRGRLATRAAPA